METFAARPLASVSSSPSSNFLHHRSLTAPSHRGFAIIHRSSLSLINEEEAESHHGSRTTASCADEMLERPVSWSPQQKTLSSSAASDTKAIPDRRKLGSLAQRDVSNQASKGSVFTSKLEEMLIDLKNKDRKIVSSGKTLVNSRKTNADMNVIMKEKRTGLEESGTLLLNLFANSPSMPWQADKTYSRFSTSKPRLPIRRKSILGRSPNGSNFDAGKGERNDLMNHNAYRGRKSSVPMNMANVSKNKVGDEMNELRKRWVGRRQTVIGRNNSPSDSDACECKENILMCPNSDSMTQNKVDGENYGLQESQDVMGKFEHDTHIRDCAEKANFFDWSDSGGEENNSSISWNALDGAETASTTTYSGTIDDDGILRQRRTSLDIHIDENNSRGPCVTSMLSCTEDQKPTWHKHNIPDLPFEFKYSYSETPNAPILGYRERPYSPFGPISRHRPWIGGRPPEPTKKKVPEFDSFNPPPRNKKGVKFVQDPGPYPPGQGPKAAKSREEIQGEPLSKEDIIYLVEKCQRESRQLNLGRDGLTHNMLDTIHCHWKRRRVCKIKCKGVPTIDMDNVCFQIEDKTGGKIIYRTGGVLYLFRGRNYNYKDRPKIPLMLWKPVTPIYPKLIQDAPGELTKEEADKLRKLGRKVEPICRIGKNGLYSTLVEDVRSAFKLDDLVRIDCQGLKPTDYKKIGAKLQDLVPCVLLSFQKEHILMWKGKSKVATTNDKSNHHKTDHAMLDQNLSQSEHTSVPCTNEQIPTERVSSGLSLHMVGAHEDGKDIERSGELQNEDTKVHVESLWDHAIECGMAIELNEVNIDSESIMEKVSKLSETAPTGPIYTHRLLKKLQIKREWKEQGEEQVQVYFGRSKYVDRPSKRGTKRNYQVPTLDVPPMGGLPLDELAKLLAV